jgi:hypothetical protein
MFINGVTTMAPLMPVRIVSTAVSAGSAPIVSAMPAMAAVANFGASARIAARESQKLRQPPPDDRRQRSGDNATSIGASAAHLRRIAHQRSGERCRGRPSIKCTMRAGKIVWKVVRSRPGSPSECCDQNRIGRRMTSQSRGDRVRLA